MTTRCLDEGIIQAYVDGELSREQAAEAASHLAACESCSNALAEVESESAVFASAFAPDESLSVPTEVLRARIGAAVAQLESSSESVEHRSQARRFNGFFASLAGLFHVTPQTAVAFASLLAVVALALVYITAQRSRQTPGQTPQATEVARANSTDVPPTIKQTPDEPAKAVTPSPAPTVEKEKSGPRYVNARFNRRPANAGGVKSQPAVEKEEVLSGEKEYQTAIASLEKTIKFGGDESLRPAVRADYEREVALLDTAIAQTRQVAAQNPKDKDAVGFLMEAYQSKVELLTRVADQAQVAALGR